MNCQAPDESIDWPRGWKGTVLLFLPVLFAMLFVAGARLRHLLVVILLGLVALPLAWVVPKAMENYQKDRVRVLIHQNTTDHRWLNGPGYQLQQSKICVGSGGVTGQGTGQGIFVRHNFLPDRHNDFIFALIGHQWGFLGGVGLLGLYLLLLGAGCWIAWGHPDPFGRLVVVGVTALLATQVFINIGMTIGLMPVTGMTLPFVSYGGSGLLCNYLALGLLLNVARHRPRHMGPMPFEFND